MLGYMTKREAKVCGFTHHGSYFGIPLWMTDEEEPMVATKFEWMWPLMDVFHVIEGFLQSVFYPDNEPCFMFRIGKEIGGD
jgi:hypothetical protein